MIIEHAFNTQWWGKPVGLITDIAFFDQSLEKQQEQLKQFAWVEYRQGYEQPAPIWKLTDAGFSHTDIQVRFKIGLHQVAASPSLDAMEVVTAADGGWTIDPTAMATFEHERFMLLPDATNQKINERYALWANNLIQEQPEWSLEIQTEGVSQGWFISQMNGKTLNLTLAVLRKDATISGMHLYHKAMVEYAKRGARIGEASYSATNTLVMGIYAKLGVRYLAPVGYWLWTPRRDV